MPAALWWRMNGQPLRRLTNCLPNRRWKARHEAFKTGATPLTATAASEPTYELDISKIEADEMALHEEPVDITKIVQSSLTLVKDTGIGIAPEDIEKVMKPFTQADGALSRVYEGTGLGLPLTKALIEMHQGTFELDSEQGVGTTAVVRFPADRALGEIHMDDLSAVS